MVWGSDIGLTLRLIFHGWYRRFYVVAMMVDRHQSWGYNQQIQKNISRLSRSVIKSATNSGGISSKLVVVGWFMSNNDWWLTLGMLSMRQWIRVVYHDIWCQPAVGLAFSDSACGETGWKKPIINQRDGSRRWTLLVNDSCSRNRLVPGWQGVCHALLAGAAPWGEPSRGFRRNYEGITNSKSTTIASDNQVG